MKPLFRFSACLPTVLALCGMTFILCTVAVAQQTGFSGERAYDHLRVLAGTIGPRPMGSPAEQRAMEYAVEKFREYGCQDAYIMPMTVADGVNTHSGVAVGISGGKTGRIIVIGGHMDSVSPDVPGANDDGSGAACVIELARVIAACRNESTVIFCCWGGEEEGLRGSTWFVQNFPQIDSVDLMLQLDMADGGGCLQIDPDGSFQTSAPEWLVRAAFRIACDSLGYTDLQYATHSMTMNAAGSGATGSDHQPFLQKGIPAIDFTSDVSYPIHTPLDNLGNFTPSGLRRSGDIVLRLFERFDGGTGPRTTEKYYLLQFGSRPVFLHYRVLWSFLVTALVVGVLALMQVRKRRVRPAQGLKIRWSGAKMLLFVIVIQVFIWFSGELVGLMRGYRFPWVNNFQGFVALGIMAGFIALWLMLRLSNRWKITVDPYVLYFHAFNFLLLYTVLLAIPGPELAIYPAFALLFLGLAMLVRVPALKLLLAAVSPFMMLHLLFPEEISLFLRGFAEIPDEFLYVAFAKGGLIVLFTLVTLPFAFGFAATYRDARVELAWLNRFEEARGFRIAVGIFALIVLYLFTRPVYDRLWARDVRVEQSYLQGSDSSSLVVRSAEYLDGLNVRSGGRDTILQGHNTRYTPAPTALPLVPWLTVERHDELARDSASTDSTPMVRRLLTLHSAFRPYMVEVMYSGPGLVTTQSTFSEGPRHRMASRPRGARVYSWYSFPDSVIALPVLLSRTGKGVVVETITVTYDTLAYPLVVGRTLTTTEYRTIVTVRDTLRPGKLNDELAEGGR